MRIHELTIENFRKFRQPLRLAGFEPGLNLLCDQNEAGKSTILEALRAVLFERHGSRSDRIRSFRPHGDEVAPTVELDFEIDGTRWRLRKRFLQSASVELESAAGRATGDEAEERLQELLGFSRAGNRGADDDSRGALGLLWVEQGQSFIIGSPGVSARRTLEDVLAGEVGLVTGGQRTQAILQNVERSLAELRTATGRPARRLSAAQDAAAAAAEDVRLAQAELDQFDTTLDRLDAKRNEQRRLLDELDDPAELEKIRKLDTDIDSAKTAAQSLKTAEALLREAAGERERLETHQTKRRDLAEALVRAETAAESARVAAKEHDDVLAAARTAESDAVTALDDARAALRTAEDARQTAQRARGARVRNRALAAAFERLDAAEAIASDQSASAEELAGTAMTPEASRELQDLEQTVAETRAAAAAGAATLEIALLAAAPPARLNGEAVAWDIRTLVTEAQTLEIDGVGTVAITPPASGEPAQARHRAAEQDLTAFLAKVGFEDAASAREAARTRVDLAQRVARLTAELQAACPADDALDIAAGLDALRGALAEEERPSAANAAESEDEGALDEEWNKARTEERTTEGRRTAALEALHVANIAGVKCAAAIEQTAAEVARFETELQAAIGDQDDAALEDALVEARAGEARTTVARDEARRAVEGLDETQLTQRRENLRRRRVRLADDRVDLASDISQLAERAKTLGGVGPASRLAAATELSDAAAAAQAKLEEEAAMLSLLARTIAEAQTEASRQFLAPVTQRVAPYIGRLLPGASISFSEDLRPTLLTRGGREEDTSDLSKGTQEQLAVLTRIAFADLLIEKGKPASLLLDDALVFADDDRFDAMLDILTEASRRMQVIVLSCRTSAYRGIDATRIAIA